MGLFDYKHEKKKEFKPRTYTEAVAKEQETVPTTPGTDLEDVLNTHNNVITNIRNKFNKEYIDNINPLFDSEIISNATALQNFLQSFFPELPPYLYQNDDGTYKLSLRALLDARDYLKNEYDMDVSDVFKDIGDGLTDKLYYRGNYSIKPDGSIWKGDEKIFDPSNAEFNRVYAIDFAKMIISVEPGVHLPFSYLLGETKQFSNYINPKSPPGNEAKNPEPGESGFDWNTRKDFIVDPINNPFYNELITKNSHIEDKEPKRVEPDPGDFINLKDVFDIVGIGDEYKDLLKNFVISPKFNPDYDTESVKGSSTCNMKDVNYFYLMFLLLLGGGNYEKAPLPKQDNQYASLQSKSDFFLCEKKSYQTGHPMMYSSKNKQGLPTSLLQICYSLLSPLFLLINIPPLGVPVPCNFKLDKFHLEVEWFVVPIFPGLCIFGFLEHFIFWLQEWISDEIRDMFKCEMEYLTPISNAEGVGLDFLESSEPICQHFHRDFKICLKDDLSVSYRSKAGFYFCTNKGNCPGYVPNTTLYNSNKESTGLKAKDIESSGSAVKAILDTIDSGEDVSFKERG